MTRGLQAGLLLAVVAGAGLRVLNLGGESLWVDEAWSIQAASKPVDEIAAWTAQDVHPPLYYWLLHFWIGIAGPSEAGARLLSAILSTLTILALYRLAARLLGPPVGVAAAALLAVSPFHLAAAQEARMYALLALLGVLSMDSFLRLIDPATRRRATTGAIYAIVTTLALYTHVYAFFVLAAQAAWLGLRSANATGEARPVWKPAAAALAASFLLFSPWLPVLLQQVSDVQHRFWLPTPDLREFWMGWIFHAGSPFVSVVVLPLALAGFASAGSRREVAFLGVWVVCLLGLPFAISSIGISIYAFKYAIAGSPAMLALAARGLMLLPFGVRLGAIVLLAWLSKASIDRDYKVLDKDDWRGATARIEAQAHAGDVVLFHQPYGQIPFDYYARRTDLVARQFPKTLGELPSADVQQVLATTVGSASRVWLVLSTADAVSPRIARELQTRYDVARHLRTQGIETLLFVAREKTSGVVSRTP